MKPPAQHREEEPLVGIFWVVSGKLVIDSTPLGEAEPYSDFLIHAAGHDEVWQRYQHSGLVPADMEYDDSPRGRVMFDTKTRRFTLLADRCILKDKGIVHQIMSELKLPKNTETDTDDHYRCSVCLRPRSE